MAYYQAVRAAIEFNFPVGNAKREATSLTQPLRNYYVGSINKLEPYLDNFVNAIGFYPLYADIKPTNQYIPNGGKWFKLKKMVG